MDISSSSPFCSNSFRQFLKLISVNVTRDDVLLRERFVIEHFSLILEAAKETPWDEGPI